MTSERNNCQDNFFTLAKHIGQASIIFFGITMQQIEPISISPSLPSLSIYACKNLMQHNYLPSNPKILLHTFGKTLACSASEVERLPGHILSDIKLDIIVGQYQEIFSADFIESICIGTTLPQSNLTEGLFYIPYRKKIFIGI